MFLLKILHNLLFLGKCLSIRERKILATLVATLLLKGGLNHVTLRFLFFLFSLHLLVGSVSNCRFGLYPLLFMASLYGGIASLNVWALLELMESRLSMPFGKFLMVGGGWLLFYECMLCCCSVFHKVCRRLFL